jgi:hypothetical protein
MIRRIAQHGNSSQRLPPAIPIDTSCRYSPSGTDASFLTICETGAVRRQLAPTRRGRERGFRSPRPPHGAVSKRVSGRTHSRWPSRFARGGEGGRRLLSILSSWRTGGEGGIRVAVRGGPAKSRFSFTSIFCIKDKSNRVPAGPARSEKFCGMDCGAWLILADTPTRLFPPSG